MGRHTDLLRAAKENEFTKILDLFNNKQQKGLKSRTRGIFSSKKKGSKPKAPVWELLKDGSIKPMQRQTDIRIECRDEQGNTPLILAALNGNLEAVECLVAYGANVNAQDSRGNTPLSLASWSNEARTETVIETLIKNGSDPNIHNNEDSGPLHNACQSGRTYVLMMLLDAGGDLHHKNASGDTPLDIAARLDRREVVSFLIDHDNTVVKSTKSMREAVMSGKREVLAVLLDSGMDPGSQDPESGDSPLHISVRFFRLELSKMLLAYGADAYLKNNANETPQSMVDQYPTSHPHKVKIIELIEEYKDKEIVTPAIEKNKKATRRAKEAIKNAAGQTEWPLIKPEETWINLSAAGTISASDPKNPVTNLLNGDQKSSWRAPGAGRQFVVFDLGSTYTITKTVLNGACTKMMPKDYQLEVSPTADGPWSVIASGETKLEAGQAVISAHLDGFVATSRFWKLHLLRNHGAPDTRLGSVEFFGVEHMMKKFFTEHGFAQYYDSFIAAGINKVSMLKDIDGTQLESIVTLAGHRRKVQLAINKLRGTDCIAFDRLIFGAPPPDQITVGEIIEPPIEVHAAPGTTEEVELIVHGSPAPDVSGSCRLPLTPREKGPSVATFSDITISPVGEYLIEIRSVQNEKIVVRAPKPTVVSLPRSRDAIEALFMPFESLLEF